MKQDSRSAADLMQAFMNSGSLEAYGLATRGYSEVGRGALVVQSGEAREISVSYWGRGEVITMLDLGGGGDAAEEAWNQMVSYLPAKWFVVVCLGNDGAMVDTLTVAPDVMAEGSWGDEQGSV